MPLSLMSFFFFNDTATTEIYTLSLHDALPISTIVRPPRTRSPRSVTKCAAVEPVPRPTLMPSRTSAAARRSEEHTSELQSRQYLVCRLLLEKKNNQKSAYPTSAIQPMQALVCP